MCRRLPTGLSNESSDVLGLFFFFLLLLSLMLGFGRRWIGVCCCAVKMAKDMCSPGYTQHLPPSPPKGEGSSLLLPPPSDPPSSTNTMGSHASTSLLSPPSCCRCGRRGLFLCNMNPAGAATTTAPLHARETFTVAVAVAVAASPTFANAEAVSGSPRLVATSVDGEMHSETEKLPGQRTRAQWPRAPARNAGKGPIGGEGFSGSAQSSHRTSAARVFATEFPSPRSR
mmetsp:Transcript_45064/g.91002  ORF Transcript_45064/g.91002 Transcript_45064/m.91002 type:complete len:228 (-) Transcript_45064:182-865(-)